MRRHIIDTDQSGIQRLDGHRWTYRDLREMPETMERLEIIDGALYIHPPENHRMHQYPLGNMLYLLRRWVDRHEVGDVFIAPAHVFIAEDTIVEPDLSFVLASRLRKMVHGDMLRGVPDLVIEVVAPWSQVFDRETKFAFYERIGVPEYWLLDPDDESVDVFVLREHGYEQQGHYAGDAAVPSELLSGFSADISDIYWELHEDEEAAHE